MDSSLPAFNKFLVCRDTTGGVPRHRSSFSYITEMTLHGPRECYKRNISVKSDVFSFGVLLLETISGKKNSRFYLTGYGHRLLTHAWNLWFAGQGIELMDPLLSDTCVKNEVMKCIQIGLLCVQEDPADGPIMSSVIYKLGRYTMPIPQPTKPAFSLE
ncbi:hypothetical protein OROHE_004619 [Orobanche hederae]